MVSVAMIYWNMISDHKTGYLNCVPEGQCSCKGNNVRSSTRLRCMGTGTARLGNTDTSPLYNLFS